MMERVGTAGKLVWLITNGRRHAQKWTRDAPSGPCGEHGRKIVAEHVLDGREMVMPINDLTRLYPPPKPGS